MKTALKHYNTDETFSPLDFAPMVVGSGIVSIWLPDQSHVPVVSRVADEDEVAFRARFGSSRLLASCLVE